MVDEPHVTAHTSTLVPSDPDLGQEGPLFRDKISLRMQEGVSLTNLAEPKDDTAREEQKLEPTADLRAWKMCVREKLYSRENDRKKLLDKFKQLCIEPVASMIIISGPSGAGKTSLCRTLKGPAEDLNGFYITGKFDQLRRPAPYTAFVSAFTEFTNMVVERGEDTVLRMRHAILESIGAEAAVLKRMIPALERILGQGEDISSKAKADDAIQRFVFVFRKFLRAVSSPEHPIVLVLDDIHWADDCSLDVLSSIVSDTANRGLVLVGTCDDNVSSKSYLSQKLRQMEDKECVGIVHIELRNLDESAVVDLISDSLHVDASTSATALGRVITNQTHGNPSFIFEFLRWLRESDLLSLDQATDSWHWDLEEIEMSISTRELGDFLVDKLEQLPKDVKEVLKVCACLGPSVDEELVEHVLGGPVFAALNEAVAREILTLDRAHGGYVFQHDGLQSAAYGLIPERERELFHVEIGRRMWRKLDQENIDRHLFTLLSQLNIGRKLITRDKERIAVASLCLHAGKKAAKSSTFRTALVYLELGIYLMGEHCWRDEYELTLALYNAAAEMAMCTTNFERMNELVDKVLVNAKALTDKTPAYASRIYALGISKRQNEAMDLGLEVLNGFGEKLPGRLSLPKLLKEYKKVRKSLWGKSDEQLLRMPLMTDAGKLSCLQILHLIFLSSLFTRPKLMPFIVLKMMNLTLSYGSSAFTSVAFATYGMACVAARFDIETAFRYGELGLRFLEKFETMEYLPRVYAAFYGTVYPWKKPIRDVLEPLLKAHRIGLQTGDVEGAFLCANLYCLNAAESGVPLGVVEREWVGFHEAMMLSRHKTLYFIVKPQIQLIHHQMGLTPDPLSKKGDILDYDEVLRWAREHEQHAAALVVSLSRLTLAFMFNDLDLAEEQARVFKDLWRLPPNFKKVHCIFVGGMIYLACARDGRNVRRNLRRVRKVIKQFDRWATMTPQNCLDKLFLLEAEMASVKGNTGEAAKKYTCSLAMAKDSGFLFMAGLANERYAHHCFTTGDRDKARSLFREACRYYREWQGMAKVRQLESEVRVLYRLDSQSDI